MIIQFVLLAGLDWNVRLCIVPAPTFPLAVNSPHGNLDCGRYFRASTEPHERNRERGRRRSWSRPCAVLLRADQLLCDLQYPSSAESVRGNYHSVSARARHHVGDFAQLAGYGPKFRATGAIEALTQQGL